MEWIKIVASWFAENESVLSGLAAFVALVGLLLSPLGGNLKELFSISRKTAEPIVAPLAVSRTSGLGFIGQRPENSWSRLS